MLRPCKVMKAAAEMGRQDRAQANRSPALRKHPMDDTSDQIQVRHSLLAVRARPELYLGALDSPRLSERLLVQGLCHALDLLITRHCTHIGLDLGEADAAIIQYDAGLPLGRKEGFQEVPAAHVLLTELYACRDERATSSVREKACSLGLPVLNALCESLFVSTTSGGRSCELRYRRGELVEPILLSETVESDSTRIEARLDRAILGRSTSLTAEALQSELSRLIDGHPCLREAITITGGRATGQS